MDVRGSGQQNAAGASHLGEISSLLHERALSSCSAELADGRLVLLNAPVEELEDSCSCLQRDVLERITFVYLYLFPDSVARSPDLLKLLDRLLAAGAGVIANTYGLPADVAACRIAQWPPDCATTEGATEIICRVSGGAPSGNFYVYRRLCALPPQAREPCGSAVLARLRAESFFWETERRLASHPFLLAAEAGALSSAQQRAILFHFYFLGWREVELFAAMAGHVGVRSGDAAVPSVLHACGADGRTELFHGLLVGNRLIAKLLVCKARAVGIEEDALLAHARSWRRKPYWLGYGPAAVAAVFALITPTFTLLCERLAAALTDRRHGYGVRPCDPLAVVLRTNRARHLSWQQAFEASAGRAIEEDAGWASYEDIQRPVCQMLGEACLFWDDLADIQ